MDNPRHSERVYRHPDSPVFCKNTKFAKCKDSYCNNEHKDKKTERCDNCKVWRWRFMKSNELDVGHWFDNPEDADEAYQKHIEMSAKKQSNINRINNSHSEIIHKFAHMDKKARISIAAKAKTQKLDKFFRPLRPSFLNLNCSLVTTTNPLNHSHCTSIGIRSPDHMKYHNKLTAVSVSPNIKKKRGTKCVYCENEHCHNKTHGKYLYSACCDLFEKNKKSGIKTEMESFEMIFCQRYHILAEAEEFELYGCTDFEHHNTNKMDLPECVKNGYFYKMKNVIKNSMEV